MTNSAPPPRPDAAAHAQTPPAPEESSETGARLPAFERALAEIRRQVSERSAPRVLDERAVELLAAARSTLGARVEAMRPRINAKGKPSASLRNELIEACVADEFAPVLAALDPQLGLDLKSIPWVRAACLGHYARGEKTRDALLLACLLRAGASLAGESGKAKAGASAAAPSLLVRMCGFNPAGARAEDIDGDGRPLPRAAAQPEGRTAPHPQVVALLLLWGADPNARGSATDPPLHFLLRGEWTPSVADTLAALAASGADPDALNARGQTAEDVAREHSQRTGHGGMRMARLAGLFRRPSGAA